MLPSDNNLGALSDLGLTKTQAKIYLCILRTNGLPIGDVSRIARLRREAVYRAVPMLEKAGLVEKIMGTPTRIRALPVEDALANLIKGEKSSFALRMKSLEDSTSDFLKRYAISREEPAAIETRTGKFVLLSEKKAIINKGTAMIKAAETRIDAIYSRMELLQFIPIYSDPLRSASKKGVETRLVTEKTREKDPLMEKTIQKYLSPLKTLPIRYAEHPPSHFIIIDQKQALSSTSLESRFAEAPNLWTDNRGLVELLSVNFESTWDSTEPRN